MKDLKCCPRCGAYLASETFKAIETNICYKCGYFYEVDINEEEVTEQYNLGVLVVEGKYNDQLFIIHNQKEKEKLISMIDQEANHVMFTFFKDGNLYQENVS